MVEPAKKYKTESRLAEAVRIRYGLKTQLSVHLHIKINDDLVKHA
jgi:hypothetical protein